MLWAEAFDTVDAAKAAYADKVFSSRTADLIAGGMDITEVDGVFTITIDQDFIDILEAGRQYGDDGTYEDEKYTWSAGDKTTWLITPETDGVLWEEYATWDGAKVEESLFVYTLGEEEVAPVEKEMIVTPDSGLIKEDGTITVTAEGADDLRIMLWAEAFDTVDAAKAAYADKVFSSRTADLIAGGMDITEVDGVFTITIDQDFIDILEAGRQYGDDGTYEDEKYTWSAGDKTTWLITPETDGVLWEEYATWDGAKVEESLFVYTLGEEEVAPVEKEMIVTPDSGLIKEDGTITVTAEGADDLRIMLWAEAFDTVDAAKAAYADKVFSSRTADLIAGGMDITEVDGVFTITIDQDFIDILEAGRQYGDDGTYEDEKYTWSAGDATTWLITPETDGVLWEEYATWDGENITESLFVYTLGEAEEDPVEPTPIESEATIGSVALPEGDPFAWANEFDKSNWSGLTVTGSLDSVYEEVSVGFTGEYWFLPFAIKAPSEITDLTAAKVSITGLRGNEPVANNYTGSQFEEYEGGNALLVVWGVEAGENEITIVVDWDGAGEAYSPKTYTLDLSGVTLLVDGAVAMIGTTQYTSLADAMNNANEGDTIKLFKDVITTIGTCYHIRNSMTIDLNGYEISGPANGSCSDDGTNATHFFRVVSGTLTIDDTSAEKNGSIFCSYSANSTALTVEILAGAKVVLNAGTLTNGTPYNFGGSVVYLRDTAEFTMNGGTVNGVKVLSNKRTYPIFIQGAACKFTMTGGIVTSDSDAISIPYNGAIVSISGGQLTGVPGSTAPNPAYIADGSYCVFDGTKNTISGTAPAEYTANINGKLYYTTQGGGNLAIAKAANGDTVTLCEETTANKTLAASQTLAITIGEDGSYSGTVSTSAGYEVVSNVNGSTTTYSVEVTPDSAIAQWNDNYYPTAYAALDAAYQANSDAAVVLLKDSAAITGIKGGILDLNGKKIEGSSSSGVIALSSVSSEYSLTVIDSVGGGQVINTYHNKAAANAYYGTIRIEAGNYVGNGTANALTASAASGDKTAGTFVITGGTFSSDPTAYLASGYAANESDGTWEVVTEAK